MYIYILNAQCILTMKYLKIFFMQLTLNQAHCSEELKKSSDASDEFVQLVKCSADQNRSENVLQFTRPVFRNSLRPSTMQGTKRSIAQPVLILFIYICIYIY